MQSKYALFARLNQILTQTREDNWNGYGAKPIPKHLIKGVKKILKLIKKQSVFICPTGIGSIQLEWEDEDCTSYFELEVFPDGSVVGWASNKAFQNLTNGAGLEKLDDARYYFSRLKENQNEQKEEQKCEQLRFDI